jgi:multiple sugar transport system substrate-binding protein
MLTRLTTIAETKSGPEIVGTGVNWPWLFDQSLVDLTDIASGIGKQIGPWHDNVFPAVVVNKKWKALPWGNIGQLEVYRTDWFKEAGVNKFPDNWEDLLAAGRLLKKKGHPFGFELGHGFGDNHGWLYPLLWSYGAQEVDKDGKTVHLDSDETAKAVDFCRRFYKETMFEDVLGWTDVSNNKAFFGEQISCTNNASSILVVGKRDFPEIAKVTDHALNPQGPKGRFHIMQAASHAVMTHAADQAAAKAFLKWLYDDKQLSRWLASGDAYYAPFLDGYDNHPMWKPEPRYLPYKESLKTTHLHGWPGPPSHAMSESVAKYVVVDMFAKACQGQSTKDVIATATGQLKQIYKVK